MTEVLIMLFIAALGLVVSIVLSKRVERREFLEKLIIWHAQGAIGYCPETEKAVSSKLVRWVANGLQR